MKLHLLIGVLLFGQVVLAGEANLSPEAVRLLLEASEVCVKLDANPERWKIAVAMSKHSDYLANQSAECQSFLIQLRQHLDCTQHCTAERGAQWAQSDLAGLRGNSRLLSYLAGLRQHPFSVHPEEELDKVHQACTKNCGAN